MFDAYLFDLDGTLINSIPSIVNSQRFALQHLLHQTLPDDQLKSGIGTPLKLQLRKHAACLKHCAESQVDDALVEQLCQTYLQHNLQSHLSGEIKPYEDVPELFAWLQKQAQMGLTKIGLVTSKARKTVEIDLEKTGLKPAFELLICGEDVSRAKPLPDPVIEALRRLHVEPSRAIYVGDALCDMQSGKAAGVYTGAALWGAFASELTSQGEADYELRSPLDLTKL